MASSFETCTLDVLSRGEQSKRMRRPNTMIYWHAMDDSCDHYYRRMGAVERRAAGYVSGFQAVYVERLLQSSSAIVGISSTRYAVLCELDC